MIGIETSAPLYTFFSSFFLFFFFLLPPPATTHFITVYIYNVHVCTWFIYIYIYIRVLLYTSFSFLELLCAVLKKMVFIWGERKTGRRAGACDGVQRSDREKSRRGRTYESEREKERNI